MTDAADIRFFRDTVEGRRGEILDAALSVFAERGYESGSLREIAERVGVSEPALYRHFASKEALFSAIIERFAERLRNDACTLLDAACATNLQAQLLAAFTYHRRKLTLYGPVLRTVLAAATHNPTFLHIYRTDMIMPLRTRLTSTTMRIDAEFGLQFTPAQTAARVRALMALFVGYFVTSIVLEDEPDETVVSSVMRIMGWPDTV